MKLSQLAAALLALGLGCAAPDLEATDELTVATEVANV